MALSEGHAEPAASVPELPCQNQPEGNKFGQQPGVPTGPI